MKPTPFRRQEQLARAQALHARGEPAAALELYRQVLKSDPGNPRLLYFVGSVELALGWTAEAKAHFQEALRKAPADLATLHDLALAHKRDGRFSEAVATLDRALAVKGDDPTLRAAKAGVLVMTNDYAGAAETLEPVLAADPPHAAAAIAFARIARRSGRQREAIELLRACVDRGIAAPAVRAEAMFQIAHLHDGLGDHDAAFEVYDSANALRTGRFDAAAHSRAVDEAIGGWTKEALARAPRGRTGSERPVFIVGMPRSGTSLVEQIIASHPSVFGAGELDDITRAVFGLTGPGPGGVTILTDPARLTRAWVEKTEREYLNRLQRLGPSAARVTDKMPTNFLQLGVIASVFPNARIIHCIRDARDTCLSCYFQNFGGSHPYSFDLRDLGRFFNDYRRLMEHWRTALPSRMLDVVYEELVADTEGSSRRVIEFLGLPWDAACLKFHESSRIVRTSSNDQVRQPIYTGSIGRWRAYERHLGPLLETLGPMA